MNWIEIMGPAGIGKSSFLEAQKKFRKSGKEWLTAEEGMREIVGKYLKKKGFQRLLQIYLNQNFISYKPPTIFKLLKTPNQNHQKFLSQYENLAESYLNWYLESSAETATEKMRRICLYKELISDLCLFDQYIPDQTIVMDEGPYNLHPALKTIPDLTSSIRPKLIVFCHLEVAENFVRIRKRERTGRLAVSHRGLNDEELMNLIHNNHEAFLKKREYLVNTNVSYLDMDLKEVLNKPILF